MTKICLVVQFLVVQVRKGIEVKIEHCTLINALNGKTIKLYARTIDVCKQE